MLNMIAPACHLHPTVRKNLAIAPPALENQTPFHDIFGATGTLVTRFLGPQGPQLRHLGLHLQGGLDSLRAIACHFGTTVGNFCPPHGQRKGRLVCYEHFGTTTSSVTRPLARLGSPIGALWVLSAGSIERVEHDGSGLPSGYHRQKNLGHRIASVRKPNALSRHFWRHRGPCHMLSGPTRSSIEAPGAASPGQA